MLIQIELVHLSCGACDIEFAVPKGFYDRRKEDGRVWHCPNGHERVFRESTVERLQKELAAEKAQRERERLAAIDARCEAQKQRLKAERVERKLKRVRNGVCPECKRSFGNLRRHMEHQHGKLVSA